MTKKIGPTYRVRFGRKREAKTNYYLRRKLLESPDPRLIIRISNKHVITQVITAHLKGDRTITTATTTQLVRDYDWKAGTRNLPAAYLTGLLVGIKAQQKNIRQVNLDVGFQSVVYGNLLFSTLKGVVDSGLQIPHNEIVFPSNERLRGEHIANYSEYIKSQQENGDNYTNQFASYKKRGLLPEDVPKHFAQTKEKILQLQK